MAVVKVERRLASGGVLSIVVCELERRLKIFPIWLVEILPEFRRDFRVTVRHDTFWHPFGHRRFTGYLLVRGGVIGRF